MPIVVKTIVSTLAGVAGKMFMKYIMDEKTIEKLILFGLEKLVASTESKADDEALKIIKEKFDEGK